MKGFRVKGNWVLGLRVFGVVEGLGLGVVEILKGKPFNLAGKHESYTVGRLTSA